jgi:two-component system, LytTR family, sensor kinase
LVSAVTNTFFPQGETIVEPGKRRNRLLTAAWWYHLLFWVLYYFFLCLVFYNAYQIHDYIFYLQFALFIPISAALVYVNFYLLIPFILYRKKYVRYGVLLLLAMLCAALLDQGLKIMYAKMGSKVFAFTADLTFQNIFLETTGMFYLTGFTTSFKLLKDWVRNQQLMKDREKHYLETELNFLKVQIQPHFFFNTLNNLYSLTLKKSDQAPEIVLKLSSLMSYMLYDSNAPKVPLTKEIAYLQSYLDLEKLRFGQRLEVIFEMEGNIEEVSIPPMILILFLENSFKHGVKNNLHQIKITISLQVKEGALFFRVTNPLSESAAKENVGIGLKNVKRRLELLYGTKYTLEISTTGGEFIVSLKMPV